MPASNCLCEVLSIQITRGTKYELLSRFGSIPRCLLLYCLPLNAISGGILSATVRPCPRPTTIFRHTEGGPVVLTLSQNWSPFLHNSVNNALRLSQPNLIISDLDHPDRTAVITIWECDKEAKQRVLNNTVHNSRVRNIFLALVTKMLFLNKLSLSYKQTNKRLWQRHVHASVPRKTSEATDISMKLSMNGMPIYVK
jgi:hypothetical protein